MRKSPCSGCIYNPRGEVKAGVVDCELVGGCVQVAEPPTAMKFEDCAYRMWFEGRGAIFDRLTGSELQHLRRQVLAGEVVAFDYGRIGGEEAAYT